MSSDEPKGWYSRGYIPHFDSPETIQHAVFRTFGSLPSHLMATLPTDKIARSRAIDFELDRSQHGRTLLNIEVSALVQSVLVHFDGQRHRLLAWCIMPNHVHAVFEQIAGWQLGGVIKSWKGVSTRLINQRTGSTGQFWAPDFYDRYMRNEAHLMQTIHYVDNNPVHARLVTAAQDWQFSSASKLTGSADLPVRP